MGKRKEQLSLFMHLLMLSRRGQSPGIHGAFDSERRLTVGKFDRVRWPQVKIFDLWFLVVGPFELFMALGREIFLRYVTDILKQIFFVKASKRFFRLCISKVIQR